MPNNMPNLGNIARNALIGGSLGGIGQAVLSAMKKRKKAILKRPIPAGMMVAPTLQKKAPKPIPQDIMMKSPKRDLSKLRRWSY